MSVQFQENNSKSLHFRLIPPGQDKLFVSEVCKTVKILEDIIGSSPVSRFRIYSKLQLATKF